MARYLLILSFLTSHLFGLRQDVGIFGSEVTYEFAKSISFSVDIQPTEDVEEVWVFFQPAGESTRIGQTIRTADGKFVFNFDATADPISPFLTITYWFRISTVDGQEFESEKFHFDYIDNRFEWETLADEQYQVSWYLGNEEFGQAILNTAKSSMVEVQNLLPSQPVFPIRIYVYSNSSELQTALLMGHNSWVAGHANPAIGIVFISISPGPSQQLELERQLPHELAHIMQYQLVASDYANIPMWLTEGVASLAELYPNPDYPRVLQNAANERSLIPMSTLCQSFPRDASGAFMAYAQSESFTRFLVERYGSGKLISLFSRYQDGLGCEEAIHAEYGVTLNHLEYRWQQEELGINAEMLAMEGLAPYLLFLAVFLIIPLLPILSRLSKAAPQGSETK